MQDNKYILAKSFVVHKDSLNILEELTDEEAGKLIKAIFKYQVSGKVEKLERGLHFIFTGFVNQFKRDQEKYIHKCEVNRENRAKQSSRIVTNDDESSRIVTNGTDKDSKKDSDSKKEKESNTDNKKEYIRKNVIETAMIKSFYRKQWNFIPDNVKEQDYKLEVYDAVVEWIIHNNKNADDFDFINISLKQVEEIYTSTSNNPEAVANIKNCIESNKPMLIPDSMRSDIKKIQDYNKPLGREEFDKRMAELKKRIHAKDIN
jgi:hypothetical protein